MKKDQPSARLATISSCGRYRYTLERVWYDKDADGNLVADRAVCFVMLNPSTADDTIDDPTVRRCMAFARRNGFNRLVVMNLFALRATDPGRLLVEEDPVGPENDEHLKSARAFDLIICAWGAHKAIVGRDAQVMRLINGPLDALTRELPITSCLGVTKDGYPRHPLYLPDDAPVIRYAGRHQREGEPCK